MAIFKIPGLRSLRILNTRGYVKRLFKKVFHCVRGVVSPLLANIVLNELDKFVEKALIPKYTKGTKRKTNPEYKKLQNAVHRAQKAGNWAKAKEISKLYANVPSGIPNDPRFGRLWYVRYADDTLFGLIGTKEEAETIKKEYGNFLKSIKLEMSEEKTLITHAKTGKARFLNYEINRTENNDKMVKQWNGEKICRRRSVNQQLWFAVPEDVIKKWADKVMKNGKVRHRAELMNLSDYDIVESYEVQLQGLINYYNRVHNGKRLSFRRYLWETSFTKTLAVKHKTIVTTIIRKYRKYTADRRRVVSVEVPRKGKKSLRATFGKKPIRRVKGTTVKDEVQAVYVVRNELITRLLATSCELSVVIRTFCKHGWMC